MANYLKDVNKKGEFVGKVSEFRNWITAKDSSGYKAESGRYHLYVSLACPYASRTLILRKLKGLDDVITVDVVDLRRTDKGWAFSEQYPDTVNNCQNISEIYLKANSEYEGAFSVPVLWDKQKKTIVNNESSEIIRMLNSEFNAFCKTDEQRKLDLYPEHLKEKIDELNSWIFPKINSGVYKCGSAKTQEAYDTAVHDLFDGLDKIEGILSTQRYLTGPTLTEADVRLFTTCVRFDWIYHGLFKCNKKMLREYPNIWGYTRDIYQIPGVAETVNKEHIIKLYSANPNFNPLGIVSIGPDLDFMAPHGREKMG